MNIKILDFYYKTIKTLNFYNKTKILKDIIHTAKSTVVTDIYIYFFIVITFIRVMSLFLIYYA